jgi:Meiotically up-regulated gene 113
LLQHQLAAKIVIYVILNRTEKALKIGKADCIATRLATLQTASATPLELVGYVDGDEFRERQIHRALHADRTNGEWFAASAWPKIAKIFQRLGGTIG